MDAIGFVGAGRLGEPMVERLLDAGHAVRVHARRPDVRIRLAALGADVVDEPAAAAESAGVVLACVFSDEQLREVTLGQGRLVAALQPGAVLASHVTGSPTTLQEIADAAAMRSAHVLDAPVSGTDADIRAGRLTVLLGGQGAQADRVAEFVSAYADPVVRTGPALSALRLKLLNNLVFAANVQVALSAAQAAADLGIATETLVAALGASSAGSGAIAGLADAGSAAAFAERVTPFLRKDVTAADHLLGVDLTVLGRAARTGPLDVGSTTTSS